LPDEARPAVRKFALSSQNNRHLKAVAELARSFPQVVLPHQALDADPYLLGVQNGTIDLRTNTFREGRREDYITKRCPVAFDPKATCPNWKKFQKQIADDSFELVEYKQKVFGLMLCGIVPELLFIAHGGGNNGKTTEGETLHAILGDYAHASDASLLITAQNATGVVFINETDAKDFLNEARVKYLTARDTIFARGFYQYPVNFSPTHKPFVRTNHKPKVRGKDLAIWRRLQYLPYTVTIPDADTIEHCEDFLVPEHPGILNYMLEGWRLYREAKFKLKPPAIILEGNQAYKTEMDKASQWVAVACEKVIGEKLPLKVLHKAYVEWFTGEIGANNQSLATTLRDHHFKDVKGHAGVTFFENIRLKTPRPDETPEPDIGPGNLFASSEPSPDDD
jgi:putative DNA primase/helicase